MFGGQVVGYVHKQVYPAIKKIIYSECWIRKKPRN